jgi:nicotinamide-nucleotide amidase
MKKISFLVTGDELLLGDIQDTNTPILAKRLQDLGGIIFQHIHTSDKKSEMIQAITYLLSHSDIIITTGGLGPTSDDNTRFAIADVLGLTLSLNEASLKHIENRLNILGLHMNEENKQQALFPKEAVIFTNDNGSANGCYISHAGKAIFMLPGPPRENQPMFEEHVLPELKKLHAFQEVYRKKWLTTGLVEGQIAAIVDAAVKTLAVETGYRWCRPHLEIKMMSHNKKTWEDACDIIDPLLEKYLVNTLGGEHDEQ